MCFGNPWLTVSRYKISYTFNPEVANYNSSQTSKGKEKEGLTRKTFHSTAPATGKKASKDEAAEKALRFLALNNHPTSCEALNAFGIEVERTMKFGERFEDGREETSLLGRSTTNLSHIHASRTSFNANWGSIFRPFKMECDEACGKLEFIRVVGFSSETDSGKQKAQQEAPQSAELFVGYTPSPTQGLSLALLCAKECRRCARICFGVHNSGCIWGGVRRSFRSKGPDKTLRRQHPVKIILSSDKKGA